MLCNRSLQQKSRRPIRHPARTSLLGQADIVHRAMIGHVGRQPRENRASLLASKGVN